MFNVFTLNSSIWCFFLTRGSTLICVGVWYLPILCLWIMALIWRVKFSFHFLSTEATYHSLKHIVISREFWIPSINFVLFQTCSIYGLLPAENKLVKIVSPFFSTSWPSLVDIIALWITQIKKQHFFQFATRSNLP